MAKKKTTKKVTEKKVAKQADVVPDTTLHDAARALCDNIDKRGLNTQVGQKEFRATVEALG